MVTIPLSALFTALAILIVLSAFFSASEIGMMAINRYRLRHLAEKGNRSAQLIERLLRRPDRLLGIILLGNNAVNVAASSVATLIALSILGQDAAIAAASVTAVVLTIVLLIFAEVSPKTLAATYPERVAFPAAYVLYWLLRLLYPVVWLINLFSNLILKPMGVKSFGTEQGLSSEELRAAVLEAGRLIPESHQTMLLNILDLEKMTVEDVMIPRGQIEGINLDTDWDDIENQIKSSRYTRLPVYSGTLDNVVGMLHMRKVLNLMDKGTLDRDSLEKVMADPYFIPEGTPLTTQLLNFRAAKRRRGLVVDEYGDIQGLVTLEEILEEIVGDFTTQTAGTSTEYVPDEDGNYLIKGSANLRDLNRSLSWSLPTGDAKTLNGLVMDFLEDIPTPGTSLKIGDYMIEIVQTRGATIQIAKVKQLSTTEPTETNPSPGD